MNRPLSSFLLGGSLAICGFAASAQQDEMSGSRYYIAPMGSLAVSQRDDAHDVAVGGTLAVGASWIPHLSLEVIGDYLRYTHVQHVGGVGLGANVYWLPDHHGVFIHADAEGGSHSMYNAGFGFDRPISNGAISFRLEALWHKEGDENAEPLFRFGLRIPFSGTRPLPAMVAQPVEVVPLEQTDAASEREGPDEVSGADEASSVPVEQPTPADTQDVAPEAAVAPVAATPQRTVRRMLHRPHETAEPPTKSQADVPATAQAIPETPMKTSMPADTGSQRAGDAAADEPVVTEPAEPSAADAEALAPTEPAPSPRGAAVLAADVQDIAPATQGRPEVSDDDGLAPTEPAPKP